MPAIEMARTSTSMEMTLGAKDELTLHTMESGVTFTIMNSLLVHSAFDTLNRPVQPKKFVREATRLLVSANQKHLSNQETIVYAP